MPRVANLATLAVMIVATWWSGTQRPVVQPLVGTTAPLATPVAAPVQAAKELGDSQVNAQVKLQRAVASATSPAAAASPLPNWQSGPAISRDSLQPVGFLPSTSSR